MIILISGCSHTGKTALAQRILEKYKISYLSIDHLKMGLIRSKYVDLTPLSDDSLITEKLWPIIVEIIKTAIENEQNLTIEGCYIPFDWKKDFSGEYLKHIRHYCLVMTEEYIDKNSENIKKYANIIEKRIDDTYSIEEFKKENIENLRLCKENGCNYILINSEYNVDIEL